MTIRQKIEGALERYPVAAVAAYFALIVASLFVTIDGGLQILQRRDAVTAASAILDRIDNRDPARAPAARSDVSAPAGSPFLEGASVSVAGAALLQRVSAAAKRANGNIQSTQLDLLGPQSKAGFIRATSSLEIDFTKLQPLLYDLEAGMPLLFVDELVVQSAPASSVDGAKLRVLLGVSGQRQSQK